MSETSESAVSVPLAGPAPTLETKQREHEDDPNDPLYLFGPDDPVPEPFPPQESSSEPPLRAESAEPRGLSYQVFLDLIDKGKLDAQSRSDRQRKLEMLEALAINPRPDLIPPVRRMLNCLIGAALWKGPRLQSGPDYDPTHSDLASLISTVNAGHNKTVSSADDTMSVAAAIPEKSPPFLYRRNEFNCKRLMPHVQVEVLDNRQSGAISVDSDTDADDTPISVAGGAIDELSKQSEIGLISAISSGLSTKPPEPHSMRSSSIASPSKVVSMHVPRVALEKPLNGQGLWKVRSHSHETFELMNEDSLVNLDIHEGKAVMVGCASRMADHPQTSDFRWYDLSLDETSERVAFALYQMPLDKLLKHVTYATSEPSKTIWDASMDELLGKLDSKWTDRADASEDITAVLRGVAVEHVVFDFVFDQYPIFDLPNSSEELKTLMKRGRTEYQKKRHLTIYKNSVDQNESTLSGMSRAMSEHAGSSYEMNEEDNKNGNDEDSAKKKQLSKEDNKDSDGYTNTDAWISQFLIRPDTDRLSQQTGKDQSVSTMKKSESNKKKKHNHHNNNKHRKNDDDQKNKDIPLKDLRLQSHPTIALTKSVNMGYASDSETESSEHSRRRSGMRSALKESDNKSDDGDESDESVDLEQQSTSQQRSGTMRERIPPRFDIGNNSSLLTTMRGFGSERAAQFKFETAAKEGRICLGCGNEVIIDADLAREDQPHITDKEGRFIFHDKMCVMLRKYIEAIRIYVIHESRKETLREKYTLPSTLSEQFAELFLNRHEFGIIKSVRVVRPKEAVERLREMLPGSLKAAGLADVQHLLHQATEEGRSEAAEEAQVQAGIQLSAMHSHHSDNNNDFLTRLPMNESTSSLRHAITSLDNFKAGDFVHELLSMNDMSYGTLGSHRARKMSAVNLYTLWHDAVSRNRDSTDRDRSQNKGGKSSGSSSSSSASAAASASGVAGTASPLRKLHRRQISNKGLVSRGVSLSVMDTMAGVNAGSPVNPLSPHGHYPYGLVTSTSIAPRSSTSPNTVYGPMISSTAMGSVPITHIRQSSRNSTLLEVPGDLVGSSASSLSHGSTIPNLNNNNNNNNNIPVMNYDLQQMQLFELLVRQHDNYDFPLNSDLNVEEMRAQMPQIFFYFDSLVHGQSVFEFVVEMLSVRENQNLWKFFNRLAVIMPTAICIKLIRDNKNEFMRFRVQHLDYFLQCIILSSDFPAATSLYCSGLIMELNSSGDAKRRLELKQLSEKYIRATKALLMTVENPHLIGLLCLVPSGIENLTLFDIALKFRLTSFADFHLLTPIIARLWATPDVMNPLLEYPRKDRNMKEILLMLWYDPSLYYFSAEGSFRVHSTAYFLYLLLVSIVSNSKIYPYERMNKSYEWLLWFFNFGFIMYESTQLYFEGASEYFNSFSNAVDSIIMLGWLCLLSLRWFIWATSSSDERTSTEKLGSTSRNRPIVVIYLILWGIQVIVVWTRSLAVLQRPASLNALTKVMEGMIKDIKNFCIILGILSIGFVLAMHYIISDDIWFQNDECFCDDINDTDDCKEGTTSTDASLELHGFSNIMLYLYQTLVGQQEWSTLSKRNSSCIDDFRSAALNLLIVLYGVVGTIMLLNLLIGIMASTYDRMKHTELTEINFARVKNTLQMHDEFSLMPAPFNTFVVMSHLILLGVQSFVWVVTLGYWTVSIRQYFPFDVQITQELMPEEEETSDDQSGSTIWSYLMGTGKTKRSNSRRSMSISPRRTRSHRRFKSEDTAEDNNATGRVGLSETDIADAKRNLKLFRPSRWNYSHYLYRYCCGDSKSFDSNNDQKNLHRNAQQNSHSLDDPSGYLSHFFAVPYLCPYCRRPARDQRLGLGGSIDTWTTILNQQVRLDEEDVGYVKRLCDGKFICQHCFRPLKSQRLLYEWQVESEIISYMVFWVCFRPILLIGYGLFVGLSHITDCFGWCSMSSNEEHVDLTAYMAEYKLSDCVRQRRKVAQESLAKDEAAHETRTALDRAGSASSDED